MNNEEIDCEHYLGQCKEKGFCLKDIGSARVWDCTAPDKATRIKMCSKGGLDADLHCPYPKLGKD